MNMNKIILLFLLLYCSFGFAQTTFEGIWINTTSEEAIQIYKEGDYYYAKSIDTDDATLVLNQMVMKDDFTLYGGTYYDVLINSEIEAKIKLIDTKTLVIKLVNKGKLFNDKLLYKRKNNSTEQITFKE